MEATIVVVLISVVCMSAVVVVSWRASLAHERMAGAVETLFDKALAFRGVNSPEAQCLSVLSELQKRSGEQMMAFTSEGRDLLKEREMAQATIKGLEMQLQAYEATLGGLGVRKRVATAPRQPHEPDIVGAFNEDL